MDAFAQEPSLTPSAINTLACKKLDERRQGSVVLVKRINETAKLLWKHSSYGAEITSSTMHE
ncbi:hypothetical protein PM082_011301 [Marasmius tenuissimus]|nr:hypothetical protein PM082_011301 [Marasmius tenuissimus]